MFPLPSEILHRLTRSVCPVIALVVGLGFGAEGLASAQAADHVVKMLNVSPGHAHHNNIFDPPVLRIAPGDRVTFEPTDTGHNSASKAGMIPEGAEPWNGKLDEKLTITFTVEGTYGYICLPHYEMGMVGLILVGDYRKNLEKARNVRQIGDAGQAFDDLFNKLEP